MVRDQARAGEVRIFDTFANEAGRSARLTGEIAKAFGARANELFAVPPQVEYFRGIQSTPPGASGPGL